MIASEAPPRLTRRRRRQRLLLNAVWTAAQLPILLAATFAALAGATAIGRELRPSISGADAATVAVPVGVLGGVAIGSLVCLRTRVWLHRVRLWRIRRSGESAIAQAVWIEGDPSVFTATEAYVVFVRWQDLAGEHIGDRGYRFWNTAPYDFLISLTDGRPVVVRFPRAQPHRFIIDIPYAPTMADAFI